MSAPPSGARKIAPMRADTCGQRNASVSYRQAQPAREQRAKSGRNLRSWPLAASAAAGTNGNGRGDQLNQRDAGTDAPLFIVKGGNGGVGAVPLGFWREGIDDEAAEQAAQTNHQGE